MNFTYRRTLRTAAVLLGALLASGTAVTLGVLSIPGAIAAAGPTTTPPWEPDANSVGGLVFYNAAGQVITGGSTIASPIAAYVEGTQPIRAGDTKATLYGYLPVNGEVPGEWSGEQLGSSTVYPNTSAPVPLNTEALPVETGGNTDETVAQLESDYPNNDSSPTDGYANMYVLRLKTSAPGQPGNTKYDSADIEVDNAAETWSVVYTQSPQVTTTTTLSVSPSATASYGATVTLSANVSPTAAAGSVQFLDGSSVLKTVALSSGVASYSTNALAGGVHQLSATFVPTDSSSYAGSSSSAQALKISAQATTISLSVPSSAYHGTVVKLSAKLSPNTAVGAVHFLDGSKVLKSVSVSSGKASYSTGTLSDGAHKVSAAFVPTDSANYAGSKSSLHSLKISAHPTATSLKVSASTSTKGTKLILTAQESPAVAGSVRFYDGKKGLATVKVSKGVARYSTTSLSVGSHSLKATFIPSSQAGDAPSTSKVVKVTVKQ
ncbi:MAG: Ig-like domain-containing protein [Acidimicrobiales bacterium]|jgi:hypothetical protein